MKSAVILVAIPLLAGCHAGSMVSTPTTATAVPTAVAPTTETRAPAAPSPATFVVKGTVLDARTKQPIGSAKIEWAGVAEAWDDQALSTLTSENGSYQISVPNRYSTGTWLAMRATRSGFNEDLHVVHLTDPDTEVDFSLTLAAGQ